MKIFYQFLCVLMILFAANSAHAHSYKQDDISIGHIWMQPTTSGVTTAAIYAPLLNTGKEPDRLIVASSDLAERVEIRQDSADHDTQKSTTLDAVTLVPNRPLTFGPHGTRLIAIGLKRSFKAGEKLPLTFKFEKAGSIKVDVMVETVGGLNCGSK